MTKSKCDNVRDRLRGYRLGEGTPLERLHVETHLEKCAGCNNELWLHHELDRAARMSPAPLSDSQKRSILQSVYEEVGNTQTATIELRGPSFWQRWMLIPAAAAACLLAVALIPSNSTSPDRPTIVATQKADTQAPPTLVEELKPVTPLVVGPGVVAFTTPKANTKVEKKPRGRRVDIQRGELVAEYTRPKGDDPLEIITPHARVIIRGTVFAVRTEATSTTVAVDRGKVEVRANDGTVTFLTAGQMIRVGAKPEQPLTQPIEENIQSNMQSHFGVQPVPTQELDKQADAPKPSTSLSRKPAKKTEVIIPKASQATAPELIRSARTLWRQGAYNDAIHAVESVLQGEGIADLSKADRNDARYLLATIHRDRGDYGKAATLLRLLAAEHNAPSARLAKLELARLTARHLGDSPQAGALLRQLTSDGVNDLIAEESLFELCALHLKAGDVKDAASCLQQFVERFSESDRVSTARELLKGLAPDAQAR